MQLANCQPLFPWDALDDSPSLATLKRFLAAIPDAPLLDSLPQARGHSRDDHPVGVLWGVVLLTIVLRHVHFEACLAELRRNDDLRALIGIPRDQEDQVPDGWNVSRFLHVLGQEPHRTHLRAVFDHMVQRLGLAVPELGCHTAGDASALKARGTKQRQTAATASAAQPSPTAADTPVAVPPTAACGPIPTTRTQAEAEDKIVWDPYGLPVAAGGRKEYTDAE